LARGSTMSGESSCTDRSDRSRHRVPKQSPSRVALDLEPSRNRRADRATRTATQAKGAIRINSVWSRAKRCFTAHPPATAANGLLCKVSFMVHPWRSFARRRIRRDVKPGVTGGPPVSLGHLLVPSINELLTGRYRPSVLIDR
jgi:hypothetical protein